MQWGHAMVLTVATLAAAVTLVTVALLTLFRLTRHAGTRRGSMT